MPAFSPNFLARLEHAIKGKCNTERHRSAISLTTEEVKDLVIPVEQRELIERASRIVEVPRNGYVHFQLDLRRITLYGQIDWLLPKMKRNLHDAPHDDPLICKLRNAVDEYVEHGRKWGKVLGLVRELDVTCSNIKQARVLFPGLVYLLDIMGETDKASSLRDGVKVASVPSLTPEVKAMCREVTEFLALTSLLPPLPDTPRGSYEFKVMTIEVSGMGENFIP